MRIAVIAVDPTRRRTGGALLGDRIRMNSLRSERVFMRSLATRRQHLATNAVLKDCIALPASRWATTWSIVETAGIGQSDSEIVDLVDFPMYVMTSDYGAPSQLEKIDMLDFADLVVLNKFDKRGAEDALRDVRKQWRRNRVAFQTQGRGRPGVSDHRQPLQRSGRQLAVRRRCAPRCDEEAGDAALDTAEWTPTRRRADGVPSRDPLIPGARVALPRRDRRAGPRGSSATIERRPRPRDARRACIESLQALERRDAAGAARCGYPTTRSPKRPPTLDAAARSATTTRSTTLAPKRSARCAPGRSARKAITDDEYSYTVRGTRGHAARTTASR